MSDLFATVAIPLRRPAVREFLKGRTSEPRGAALQILDQRPTRAAQQAWAKRLSSPPVTAADWQALADPHGYLVSTHTDRLVPEQFLQEPDFLTRAPGGWAPIYFAVVGLPEPVPADPLLDQMEVLTRYGSSIDAFMADPDHLMERLPDEMQAPPVQVADAVNRVHELYVAHANDPDAHIRALYAALQGEAPLTTPSGHEVPEPLLCDALMDRLVRVEAARRTEQANHDEATMNRLQTLLDGWRDELGLTVILKGEYIAGRHRRSTIVIAEALDRVIKQPAPEPFHDIELGARTVDGELENWPYLTNGGAVVMPQGRIRLILEEDVVPRLNRAFDHDVQFSTLLGLIIEDYVTGPTLQEWAQAKPERMTEAVYEQVLATQQVCELLKVNNPDWHSANFIVNADADTREPDLVHIDWGAARPLHNGEHTPDQRRARLNKVQNLAFSFNDDALAERVRTFHDALTSSDDALARIRRRAEARLDASA